MAFIPGAYKLLVTPPWAGGQEFNAGSTQDGLHLTIERFGEPITVDELGRIKVDGVDHGIGVQFELVAMEWTQALLDALLYPYADEVNHHLRIGVQGVSDVGRLWSERAFQGVIYPLRLPGVKRTFWRCRSVEPMDLLLSGTVPAKIPFRCEVIPDLAKTGKEFMEYAPVTE